MEHLRNKRIYQKLRNTYIFALSAIAITFISSQLLVQNHLSNQIGISEEINRSGRQRMLSQKITKELLLIQVFPLDSKMSQLRSDLTEDVALWTDSHDLLNSEEYLKDNYYGDDIKSLFDQIEPHYQLLKSEAEAVSLGQGIISSKNEILDTEAQFLRTMDEIVAYFDKNGERKVQQLRRIELILFFVGLLILLLEFLFLFRPGVDAIKGYLNSIYQYNYELEATLEELNHTKNEKVKLNGELMALNEALTHSVSYAILRSDNVIIHISNRLIDWLGQPLIDPNTRIQDVVSIDIRQRDQFEGLLESADMLYKRIQIDLTVKRQLQNTYEVELIPINTLNSPYHRLLIFNDITDRISVQREVDKTREEKFTERIEEQKTKSLLIIEAQENERKRIARDLHDGIGQKLTGLKFQIQALVSRTTGRNQKELSTLNDSIRGIIKDVRLVTFNLTPPELTDYGLPSALDILIRKVAKETQINISFIIEHDVSERMDPHIETNLYRVTQEAINNAIKYAYSDQVVVIYNRNDRMLSITIEDRGRGFDVDQVMCTDKESGMGLEFMRERVNYLKGRLFINSALGDGTIITINIPADQLNFA